MPAPSDGLQTPSGLETPSGMTSVVSSVAGGLETPDFLELRKNAARAPSEDTGPRSLYQVVPEKQTSVRGLMGSERGYDVSAVANPNASIPVLGDERGTKVSIQSSVFRLVSRADAFPPQRKANGVDISIDAAELEGMSEEELRRRYDQHSRGTAGVPGAGNKEDFSDLIAKEMAKKKQKMERDRERDRDGRKEREFKF